MAVSNCNNPNRVFADDVCDVVRKNAQTYAAISFGRSRGNSGSCIILAIASTLRRENAIRVPVLLTDSRRRSRRILAQLRRARSGASAKMPVDIPQHVCERTPLRKPGINHLKPALDLFFPGCIRFFVSCRLATLQECSGQFQLLGLRQLQRFLRDVCQPAAHIRPAYNSKSPLSRGSVVTGQFESSLAKNAIVCPGFSRAFSPSGRIEEPASTPATARTKRRTFVL